MIERSSPARKHRELGFGLLCVAAAAVCTALAFWFAVPLRSEQTLPLPEQRELSAYMLVDLNTADADALCILPGIGARRAEAILSYRAEHGPFAQVEEVMQVPGITQEIVDSWGGQAYVR